MFSGSNSVGITALKKKGLRLDCLSNIRCLVFVGITALKKKGLRHSMTARLPKPSLVGITALKKKGLRPCQPLQPSLHPRSWNHRPEEEGITTALGKRAGIEPALESPP